MKRQLLITASAAALLVGACGDDSGGTAERTAAEVEEGAGEAASEAVESATEAAGDAQEAAGEAAEEVEGVDPSEAGEAAADVVAELRDRGLNTVATAIEAVGIEQVIDHESFTLLAPSDEAFLSLSSDDLAGLLADPERAGQILRDHVLENRLLSGELSGISEVRTSAGNTVPVTADGARVSIGGATVTEADIEVGGGVIHVVDAIVTSDAAGATGS